MVKKLRGKGSGGRKMKISFSRSTVTRHEARDRSLEHELIENRGGVARYTIRRMPRGRKKEKKEAEVGSPPLLVTLLYIAHFLARVYEAIRAYLDD